MNWIERLILGLEITSSGLRWYDAATDADSDEGEEISEAEAIFGGLTILAKLTEAADKPELAQQLSDMASRFDPKTNAEPELTQ
jgi:hypothetical protein